MIAEILSRKTIRNQAELLRALRERGIRVTQSSVSRDLKEMGVVHAEGRYLLQSALSGPGPHPAELLRVAGFILQASPAGPNLLVVKTPPGLATSVALALDQADWTEVVGTVAGDDTFFLATPGLKEQKVVAARIASITKEGTGG